MPEDETMDTDNTKYKDGVNKNARLIVRNISFKATEDSLRDHFSSYGTVEEVKLLRKPDGKLVGSGFVHFTHVPMANKALTATNKKPFMGRPIFVSWAVPKHKYVQEENKVQQEPKLDSTPSQDFEEVKREILMPEEEEKHKIQRINRNARLIVRNISFKATEESLKDHFEPYGIVQEVKLLKKPDGKLVGCAFVHFKNVPMAKKALLNTNMKPFLGRPISVDWAVAKDKYMQHVVSQQIEMEEKIKKEESDSEEDDPPLNISNEELKQEVKSESDDGSDDSDDEDEKSDEESEEDDEVDDDNESNDEDIDEDEEMDDDKSVTSAVAEKKRIQLNDAEDGLTVFLSNVPFSVDDEQLRQFAEQTGPVKYALICVDKLTEHSKGSGFVKFVNQADAEKFLSLPVEQLRLEGQVVQVKPALKRENLQKGSKKQPKDNRNLYLVKEGVVVAGTRAAVGVSASDMAKRLTLERSKTQMLKNLNRFVSRYRLVVANLPQQWDDARLRRECARAAGKHALIGEARIMRDLRAPVDRTGKHPSKGYGFVMFTRHEDALTCLRKLNNNPDVIDRNNRPIVSFSIEDRTALNARKKRLEKSIANNPLAKKELGSVEGGKNRKRKMKTAPDESYMKKGKFGKKFKDQNGVGKFVRMPKTGDVGEYTGLTAKEGSQHKMRNNHKLRAQQEIHRQTVKDEKKKNKRTSRLKMAARERIKLPKQIVNKNKTASRRKKFKNV
ncbi:RNA-binding protein 28 [Papilio machaon]|uniref:RNA-binding protein 28 n=1 Tax=Papilio machaon TaxID=76193 RepID=UPI001E6644B4|nr:RNA-binding protein 28 [Papilio machaon]